MYRFKRFQVPGVPRNPAGSRAIRQPLWHTRLGETAQLWRSTQIIKLFSPKKVLYSPHRTRGRAQRSGLQVQTYFKVRYALPRSPQQRIGSEETTCRHACVRVHVHLFVRSRGSRDRRLPPDESGAGGSRAPHARRRGRRRGPGLRRGSVGRASDSVDDGVVTFITVDRIFALATCHRPNDRAQPSVARATSGDSKG